MSQILKFWNFEKAKWGLADVLLESTGDGNSKSQSFHLVFRFMSRVFYISTSKLCLVDRYIERHWLWLINIHITLSGNAKQTKTKQEAGS